MLSISNLIADRLQGYIPPKRDPILRDLETTLRLSGVGISKSLGLAFYGECIQPTDFVVTTSGYYQIKRNGKTNWMHRVVYEIVKGPLSSDLVVRHTCHNKACINPDHLISGTHADNHRDQYEAGLYAGSATPGEKHHNAKLNADQVKAIFLYKCPLSGMELARLYGVDNSTISRIKKQKDWVIVTQHLPGSKFLKAPTFGGK